MSARRSRNVAQSMRTGASRILIRERTLVGAAERTRNIWALAPERRTQAAAEGGPLRALADGFILAPAAWQAPHFATIFSAP